MIVLFNITSLAAATTPIYIYSVPRSNATGVENCICSFYLVYIFLVKTCNLIMYIGIGLVKLLESTIIY